MRFIIVQIKDDRIRRFAPFLPYRATCSKDAGGTIDVWFWALDMDDATRTIARKYPQATFSHQERVP